jgi:hypothetical protein
MRDWVLSGHEIWRACPVPQSRWFIQLQCLLIWHEQAPNTEVKSHGTNISNSDLTFKWPSWCSNFSIWFTKMYYMNKKRYNYKINGILQKIKQRLCSISNKSPTCCNIFPVYYPDVCLQLNMFRVFSRPSSGAQWLQWQPVVLPSYRGDSCVVFRSCHCSRRAPDNGQEYARNMLSCK